LSTRSGGFTTPRSFFIKRENNMVRLRDVIDFDKIEEVAKRVEKKRTLSTMKLSDEEMEIASQYIKDHERKYGESLTSLSKITGLSWPCLKSIRDKQSNIMHTKTYNVFENIINTGLTAKAAEEESQKALEQDIADSEAADKVVAEKIKEEVNNEISEFEGMKIIDDVLTKMADYNTRKRVIRYFDTKFVKEAKCEES
jgi:hypothetical protein